MRQAARGFRRPDGEAGYITHWKRPAGTPLRIDAPYGCSTQGAPAMWTLRARAGCSMYTGGDTHVLIQRWPFQGGMDQDARTLFIYKRGIYDLKQTREVDTSMDHNSNVKAAQLPSPTVCGTGRMAPAPGGRSETQLARGCVCDANCWLFGREIQVATEVHRARRRYFEGAPGHPRGVSWRWMKTTRGEGRLILQSACANP